MSIKQRKKDHVSLATSGSVDYEQATGFRQFRLKHNALPEINREEVSTEVELLGRSFDFPLFISSMTGGYSDGKAVNAIIAAFCEDYNLPFGVGSQRIMLENPDAIESFSIVREEAPTAFIASNIGGAQLVGGLAEKDISTLIETIRADAVIVHLNPLQELMQPEGDRNFKGIEEGICQLCEGTELPIIVKETGAGISGEVARRLIEGGVSVIDTAGAGGTSWAKVENKRNTKTGANNDFNNWGISTVDCLLQMQKLRDSHRFEVIASGGIRSSFDVAKALCLGADFGAAAQPIIKAVVKGGFDAVEKLYLNWQNKLEIILTLLGCADVDELSGEHLL